MHLGEDASIFVSLSPGSVLLLLFTSTGLGIYLMITISAFKLILQGNTLPSIVAKRKVAKLVEILPKVQ